MRHVIAVLGIFWSMSAMAVDADLLAVCAGCHGDDGNEISNPHAPVIAAIPAPHFEEAIYAYQDGARRCRDEKAMCSAVSNLTEEQVAELADHYSAIERVASNDVFDPALAEAGKALHQEHCERCHKSPDDKQAESALGIPLNGQRAAYLRYATYAYLRGDRATLVPTMAVKLVKLTENEIESLIHYYASYQP